PDLRFPRCRGLSAVGAERGRDARDERAGLDQRARRGGGRGRCAGRVHVERRDARAAQGSRPGGRGDAGDARRYDRHLQALEVSRRAGGRAACTRARTRRRHGESVDADRSRRHQADADRQDHPRCGARQDPCIRRYGPESRARRRRRARPSARAREGAQGRAVYSRRPRHEPRADPRDRRGALRPAAAEGEAAALARLSDRRGLRARGTDHGPRAARDARRRADVDEAHVFLEREGRARARLHVARSGRSGRGRDRLVREERVPVMEAKARARANIALVKYWGKADSRLKIPAVGSISITLDKLWTATTVRFAPGVDTDTLELDGVPRPDRLTRVSATLDLLRELAGTSARARVVSRNNFPTGAGLASSASGFAALVGAGAA